MGIKKRNRKTGQHLSGGIEAPNAVADVFASLVGFGEYLMGSLAKVVDDANRGETLDWVGYIIEVFGAVVGEVMEDVNAFDGGFSALLAAEDEVDPLVQVFAHMWTLEGFSMLGDKYFGISLRPRRKLDGVDAPTIALSHAKIVAIAVREEFGEVEELRNQFSNVAHIVFRSRLPGFLDRIEQSIRMIEIATLEQEIRLNERLKSDEI